MSIDTSKFYVIGVISNPVRFRSRYELARKWARHMRASGAKFVLVEQAFGDRSFEVTDPNIPWHLQVRSSDELWHKENMINLGVQHLTQKLDPRWEYMAWIDCDIEFTRPDWLTETVQQLQHYSVVQMFETAIDLGPSNEALQVHHGFMASYLKGKPRPKPGYGYPHWHPGFAWAIRRGTYNDLGGLYDVSILGSGDHLMAWSLIGEGRDKLPGAMSKGYRESLADWESRATRLVKRNVGFVSGNILHYWHGKKKDRRYQERWQFLERSQFDPYMDLKRDAYGLYQLDVDNSERMIQLRDDLRGYFRARNEDSIDLV